MITVIEVYVGLGVWVVGLGMILGCGFRVLEVGLKLSSHTWYAGLYATYSLVH